MRWRFLGDPKKVRLNCFWCPSRKYEKSRRKKAFRLLFHFGLYVEEWGFAPLCSDVPLPPPPFPLSYCLFSRIVFFINYPEVMKNNEPYTLGVYGSILNVKLEQFYFIFWNHFSTILLINLGIRLKTHQSRHKLKFILLFSIWLYFSLGVPSQFRGPISL